MNVSEWMRGIVMMRVLDEGMDEVNVSEWMYGGIVMR